MTDIAEQPPTPSYNAAIAEDCAMPRHAALLHAAFSACAPLAEAAVLLKAPSPCTPAPRTPQNPSAAATPRPGRCDVGAARSASAATGLRARGALSAGVPQVWLRQRGLAGAPDGAGGFLLSVLLAYLVQERAVNAKMSSYQARPDPRPPLASDSLHARQVPGRLDAPRTHSAARAGGGGSRAPDAPADGEGLGPGAARGMGVSGRPGKTAGGRDAAPRAVRQEHRRGGHRRVSRG